MFQFEKNAEKYEQVRAKIKYPDELYQYLASLCENHAQALDIGCGNGVSTIRLDKYFSALTGVDLGENLINFARSSFPQISFEVGRVENCNFNSQFDLITSATSFYWMDRSLIISKMKTWLTSNGVFCAYKYDFPILYGRLRDFIAYELATKWAQYRDKRLIEYDDTLELLNQSNLFKQTGRFLISNILELTPREVAYFFLSTSYVTQYIENTSDNAYPDWFMQQINTICAEENVTQVKVNFDIVAFYGKK